MTFIQVPDFRHGINRLRPQVAGVPGALWNGINCVLSRGGDVESCKKFVAEYTLPAGTFGLAGVNAVPFVFGTIATPGGMPADVSYQRLTYGGAATLLKIHDAKPFAGLMYVIAEFDDGDIRHFYNGAVVAEWQTLADANWTYTTIAKQLAAKINARSDVSAKAVDTRVLVTAVVSGTPFTLTTATTDSANVPGSLPTAVKTTIAANVARVAEVRATATVTITGGSNSPGVNSVSQIAIGASNLLTAPVNWVLSNDATAAAIALAITSAATAGYSATSVGPVVTILAPPGLGATINGTAPVVTLLGNVTRSQTSMAGGVTAVAAVTQVEQITVSATAADTLDTWKITVNGTTYLTIGRASATGTLIHIVKRRLWIPVGAIIRFCKLSAPATWTTMAGVAATDPGFIDTSTDSEGNDDIISLAEHNGNTGFFSETNIRVYALDTDATAIKIVQVLENSGSISKKAPLQYGNSDIYYLSMTGLKSVRSRLGYNFAYTLDVGSSISTYLQDYVALVGQAIAADSQAVIEPREGRYMLCINNTVFVYSDFAESGVAGWTEIDLPFTPEQFVSIGRRVMARSGNTIYVYGGLAGTVYPNANEYPVTVGLPFLVGSEPEGKKTETGFGMAGAGTWYVQVLVDPNDTTKKVRVGYVNKITFPQGIVKVPAYTTHIAPLLTCATGGRVTLSSLAFSYERGEST